jgi:hypothetical protein
MASTVVPARVRLQGIVLDESDLQREMVRLTDRHTDQIFSWVLELGGTLFVNTLSCLVFDPERFLDDEDEPMAAVGRGAVHTRTADGTRSATISDDERERRRGEAISERRAGNYSSTGRGRRGRCCAWWVRSCRSRSTTTPSAPLASNSSCMRRCGCASGAAESLNTSLPRSVLRGRRTPPPP